MRPKLVFCGPTLTPADRPQEAGLIFLPPALQGSFLRAVKRYDPQSILLIDGGFQSEPAVRHKEILWTIDRGIAVLGAASMGALRAAELAPHMQGFGLIYRWYRRFALVPDDAVAVQHGPEELGFAAVTQSLVDLRLTLRDGARRGAIDAALRQALEAASTRMDFRERSMAGVIAAVVPERERAAVEAALALLPRQQKRRDALTALAALRDGRHAPARAIADLPMTRVFAAELEDAGWPPPC